MESPSVACSKKGLHMHPTKSLDEIIKIIAAMLEDVHNAHSSIFDTAALRNTVKAVERSVDTQGIGYITKTLPLLGKALDAALVNGQLTTSPTTPRRYLKGWKILKSLGEKYVTEIPMFMGELFSRVFHPDGKLLELPCVDSVKMLRQVLYSFYKYELPYTDEQEQQVLSLFKDTESELSTRQDFELVMAQDLVNSYQNRRKPNNKAPSVAEIMREARILLSGLFATFDPKDIYPRHGPGSVATKQRLWEKFRWTNVSARITAVYPYDEYFCSSGGHVCDTFDQFDLVGGEDLPARVVLVPKDSRGPRLISEEPVDFQWIQQGLGRAIVEHVEGHPLTRENVRFTDQTPNRNAALLGSRDGKYSTLDLKEASDRVSFGLVRLLFPGYLCRYLGACRSLSTELPNGEVLRLLKFAPMGSCLCFPIMALTVWAILTAGASDAHTRERVYVYGDDVIVPTAHAANAIEQLEAFGLKVNRAKSCTSGLFRESCGMDAFKGVDVTPVRFKTVWSSSQRAEVYTAWIAYANSMWDRRFYRTYDLIVGWLRSVYGPLPCDSMQLSVPSIRWQPEDQKPKTSRVNKRYQKREWLVRDVTTPSIFRPINGWSMLLRYFSEKVGRPWDRLDVTEPSPLEVREPTSVLQYTDRNTGKLVFRWR